MAPSPSVLARASTASDASRGTVAARTLARIHPPGSSPGPGFSRPGRTCTSAPGTSGDDDGDPGRALSSRNGRNSASGAMNRVRSSVVVRGSSPGGLDAGLGSFSAVADIATTGAPSMEPESVVVVVRARRFVVEEGGVGGDVAARVGAAHPHRRREPDGSSGHLRWTLHRPTDRNPRADPATRARTLALLVTHHHNPVFRETAPRRKPPLTPDPKLASHNAQPDARHGDEEARVQG